MKPYKSLLLLAIIIPILAQANDTVRVSHKFADKVIHSFNIQYNNCFYPKATFDYKGDWPKILEPKIGYQREWMFDYNIVFPSGVGLSIGYSQGYHGMRVKNTIDGINDSNYPFNLFVFPCIGFYNLGIKATYLYPLTDRMFIKSELGLKIPYFCEHFSAFGEYDPMNVNDTLFYMYIDNYDCSNNFIPDLSAGISLLFHTKRNPRSNFIIGLNANIGFVKRYQGYYALRSPFSAAESVCDISSTSTYFGINLGYSFLTLPKTFFLKQHWQTKPYEEFDLHKPVHSISLSYNNAFAVGGKVENKQGLVQAKVPVKFTPEFALKYSCTIAKGFGISAEVPIGLFSRRFKLDLSGFLPTDTVWSNGAIGLENFYGNELVFGDFHSGFALRASYLTSIHRNVSLQSELGLSFTPLLHKQESYDESMGSILAVIYPNHEYSYDIPFAVLKPKVINQNYWIPNLSGAVNFLVHGKNPCHNFVFGLNFNVDFTKRMTIDYQTVPTFPDKYKSFGQIVFSMTTIGLHVGYQFMTGKKEAKRP